MANLLSLDDYKLLEGINSTQNDDKFEQLLTSVSTLVRSYTGQEFDTYVGSPGRTELFDIQWESPMVQLEETPVINITGVFERKSQSDAYTELFRNGTNGQYDWYFDTVTETVIRTTEAGQYRDWPKGVGSVKVTYTAGYASTPEDLKLAVADLVTYYHKEEYKQNQTIGSTTREGAAATAVGDTGFPDHIRRVLDLYRDV
jgi:hypothetical protein